ncbi:MAG: DUF6037 family protein [Paraclostridium sordellii]
MKLDNLINLYNDMKQERINRCKFIFKYNNTVFDVFFFIDEVPFKLALGVRVKNFYLELDVKRGSEVNPYINDRKKYRELISVLELSYNSQTPFSPIYLFSKLNESIPKSIASTTKWKPQDTAQYKRDVEEADKIYFCGWVDNNLVNKKVREQNLKKTKEILGLQAYEMCKSKNISSKWTDRKRDLIEFNLP